MPPPPPGRPCGHCGQPLPPDPPTRGRGPIRQYHPECLAVRTLEKNRRHRKAVKGGRPEQACKVCGVAFRPKGGPQVYCSPGCSARGLQMAIERQAERRRQAKLGRLKEKAPAPARPGEHETGTAADAGVGDGRGG